MADYILREDAIEAHCMSCQNIDQEDDKNACWCMEKDRINRIPAADVVSRDCYARILAENDTMREMLAQIGKKPGDKMDDVRPVSRGKWKHDGSDWKNRFICDQCGYKWFFEAEEAHFCPNCGCAMENEKLRQAYGYDVLR